MPYLAKTTIVGHIGKDAVTKNLSDGKSLVTFTVAVNVGYGEKKVTNWFEVVSFRQIPDWKMQKLTKGAIVLVMGDFKHTVTESNDKHYNHLNINAETIEVLPKVEKQETQGNGEPVQGTFDDDIPPF